MPVLIRKIVVSSLSIALCSLYGTRSRARHRFRGEQRRRRLVARNSDTFGIRPQAFQSVVLAGILPEDMDDHVAEIHQYPLRRSFPFDAQGTTSGLRQNAVNMIGNRSSLPVGLCGTQNQV